MWRNKVASDVLHVTYLQNMNSQLQTVPVPTGHKPNL